MKIRVQQIGATALVLSAVVLGNPAYTTAQDMTASTKAPAATMQSVTPSTEHSVAAVGTNHSLIAVLEEAVKHKPKDRGLRNQLAQMYLAEGQYDMALTLFEKSMKHGSLIPESYNNRAMLYYKMKRHAEAKDDLAHALQLEAKDHFPDSTVNMTEGLMGNILAEEGDYSGALPYFESVYKRTPSNMINVFNYAQALEMTGKREAAKAVYMKLVGQERSLGSSLMTKVQARIDGDWDTFTEWL